MDAERLARRYRGRMVRALSRDAIVTDPRWREAFADVPRHEFLPRFFRPTSSDTWLPVDSGDPDWLAQIYANSVLVTQLDNDPDSWTRAKRLGELRGVPTSSSSMPGIMAVMLEALDVVDDSRVLEIGTGTGYNAALLCHRLGSDRVSTVDIDPALVEAAMTRLEVAGYHPTCVATDGAEAYPPNAPYDRVLSTCAVSTVPPQWLAQTRPGGLVVTTLNRPIGAGLVRIVAGEGATGTGQVLADDGRFMPLRAHRRYVDESLVAALTDAPGEVRGTDLSATTVLSPASPFEFFAGLAVPDVVPTAAARHTHLLVHPDGSWVRHRAAGETHEVTQGGPRLLWDEIEQAYRTWQSLGQPRRSRFGITIGPTTQTLWLATPTSPYQWTLTNQN